jgi:serine/threonine protein kinase/Tfp pilus assembly protein PilF
MSDAPPSRDETAPDKAPASRRAGLTRGTSIGRFLLLDQLGQGGMGVVYKAYDPELDRPVALKLVRTSDEDTARGHNRLLREAQALARLQHPNVIAVYDVGTYSGDVFIAMEFVEGKTLRKWLSEQPRTRRQIIDAFLAAGQGLAAAHKSGLVHRDFKPDNVIVGDDGRVRVLDFGLARAPAGVEPHTAPADDDGAPAPALEEAENETVNARRSSSRSEQPAHHAAEVSYSSSGSSASARGSSNMLATPLTHADVILGTPLFMAPEQHLGRSADERADQFSFCVSLYYALYGEFPFASQNLDEVADDQVFSKVDDPPAGSTVPRWLRQALLRGLQVKPRERYPSMSALLEALQADPSVRRQRWLRAAALLLVLAGVMLTWLTARRREVRACAGAERKLAGVWDEPQRAAIRQAFRATGRPYADAVLATVEHTLDAYAHAWVTMHVDACEATQVRGEQSQDLLDLRMTCLADRLTQLKTLAGVYASADASVLERAAQSAQSLPGLELCADAAALRAPIAPPRDTQTRQRVEDVRQRLARASALELAARYDEAIALTKAAITDAAALDYAPVQAEAQLRLGTLLGEKGEFAESARVLHDALVSALEGRHDEAAARAAINLITAVGSNQAHYEEGDRWAKVAQALTHRFRNNDELLGTFFTRRANLRKEEGKYKDAVSDAKRALELKLKALGPDHDSVAETYHLLGNIYLQTAQYAEAIDSYQRSVVIRERTLGPDHPKLVAAITSIAAVYGESGEHERSIAEHRRAIALLERVHPDHPYLATVRNNLGAEFLGVERGQEAFEQFKLALDDFRKRVGPGTQTVMALDNLGNAKLQMKEPVEALHYYQLALDECDRVLGGVHSFCGEILGGMGDAYLQQGKENEALSYFQRSVSVGEKALGPNHPQVAESWLGIGRLLLRRHRLAEAKAPLERSLAIYQSQGVEPLRLADVQFALARALPASDRKRAIALATQARDAYAKGGASQHHHELNVAAWLEHPR